MYSLYKIDPIIFEQECRFRTSRSSGKGGQNVNKVETKVELLFDISSSALFDDEQKALLLQKLAARLNADGRFSVVCEEERSQLKNKELAVEKAIALMEKALKPVKPRKKTKPSQASVEKRLDNKKRVAEKKRERKIKGV